MTKLLKFDIVHPSEYLEQKKEEWDDLEELSLEEYRERLIKLRSNYSDYYTYHLNNKDNWEAEEFFLLDDTYIEKTAKKLFGLDRSIKKWWYGLNKTRLRYNKRRWRNYVIDQYIKHFKPDVIFVRSQPLPSSYWQKYRDSSLLVARLSARLPYNWHPNHWDLIYTDQPDFKTFFELHGVQTILNDQGFDSRINEDLRENSVNKDIVFVGGLGTENFLQRTEFLNKVVPHLPRFKWWGYWWKYGNDGRTLDDFPKLKQSFQGFTSGLEMYQIYKDSFITLNDYVDTANGIGFNQRMFEIMGVGGFMLTREAPNFKEDFPENVFATFSDERDLLKKIDYYKSHPQKRDEIAVNAKKFIQNNYDYKKICTQFMSDLELALTEKYS